MQLLEPGTERDPAVSRPPGNEFWNDTSAIHCSEKHRSSCVMILSECRGGDRKSSEKTFVSNSKVLSLETVRITVEVQSLLASVKSSATVQSPNR